MTITRHAIYIAAFLICGACTQSVNKDDKFVRLTDELAQVKSDAHAAHPDDVNTASGIANDAIDDRLQKLSLEGPGNPREIAALAFLGYYTKNAYGAPQVCLEEGVQLTVYRAKFVSVHRDMIAMSEKLVDVSAWTEQRKSTVKAAAREELARVARARGVDIHEVCILIEANGAAVAENGRYDKISPRLASQLMQSP
jgi:hypothetical protein